MDKKRNLASLTQDAQRRGAAFDRKTSMKKDAGSQHIDGKAVEGSLKAFYKEFKKVVDSGDVILEVLDARDPQGSRCQEVEEAVFNAGTNKKLVLVLNKIDLVPRENVEAWLKYLRNECPTVAFKACTQTQNENLSRTKVPLDLASDDLRKSSRCLGADMLMKLLGNYCRNADIKTTIRVGVVGFPNTGKSSIINSLKRSKACNVGSTPGVTRLMQEVQLDKHIKLLDSPGIVMATGTSDTSVILRNCVRLEGLPDPISPVDAILKRCDKKQMMLHYNLADYKDVNEFLSLLATRLGKLKKGGLPDVDKAARVVLQDWTNGKITYFTHPPEQHTLPTHVSAEFVQQMATAFDISTITDQEKDMLQGLEMKNTQQMVVNSFGPMKGVVSEEEIVEDAAMSDEEKPPTEEEEDEGMEHSEDDWEDEEELKDVTVSLPGSGATTRSTQSLVGTGKPGKKSSRMAVNEQLNKSRKKDYKKMKKKRKKADMLAGKLSDALTEAMSFGADDKYDFTAM
ncbi:guanine nucleotide-binding protein-like 3-like protein isoform X2 [Liolophura sinensis]